MDVRVVALAGALLANAEETAAFRAAADLPVLTLDAARYCSESQWRLTIRNGVPRAPIRLVIRNDNHQEQISPLGHTDADGRFTGNGAAVRWSTGKYSAQVEIDGMLSNVVFYEALPCVAIDLNGTYTAPSSADSILGAVASATTNARGDRRGEGQVYERNQGVAVPEGTYTPFSDDLNRPRALDGLDLRGTQFRCDVDLHDVKAWKFDAEFFQIGAGRQADPTDSGTEEFFVFIYRWGINQFALYMETDWTEYRPATTYYSAADETRFRIQVNVDTAGTEALLTVVPLNGAAAGREHAVEPLPLDLRHDNFTSASFFAGFTQNYARVNSTARATLSDCVIDGVP